MSGKLAGGLTETSRLKTRKTNKQTNRRLPLYEVDEPPVAPGNETVNPPCGPGAAGVKRPRSADDRIQNKVTTNATFYG